MAVREDHDPILVRMMGNGYIRSHLKEVESLSFTSGRYYALYGDNKKIDEKTNRSVELQKSGLLKQYKTLELYVFDTRPMEVTFDFSAESKDFKKITGNVVCSYHLNGNRISKAETVELRNSPDGTKQFRGSDISNRVESEIQSNIIAILKGYDSEDITNDNEPILQECCSVPAAVTKWMSVHGFSFSVDGVMILSNERDTDRKNEIKHKEELERKHKELELQEIESQLSKQKAQAKHEEDLIRKRNALASQELDTQLARQRAKNQIDKETGESKAVTDFKREYARKVINGNSAECGEIRESGTFIIEILPEGCLLNGSNDISPTMTLPSRISDGSMSLDITEIGPKVFAKDPKTVKEVIIEDGVMYIDNTAFQNCTNLCSVTLPDSIKSIGANAFTNCLNLRSITIPKNIERIDPDAFIGCPLREITLPEGFNGSSLKIPRTTRIRRH